jgi:uncharacterized membrane protein YbhN (UPF0104 family)
VPATGCREHTGPVGAAVIADAPAVLPADAPPRPGAPLQRQRRPRASLVLAALLVIAGGATWTAAAIDADSGKDLLVLGSSVGADIAHLRWQFGAIVLALAAAHYAATAIAARAAATVSLRFGETVLVQLAAAAANRLTPGGLGGSAVNARFFTRRGLDVRTAIGAVATLTVLGAVADLTLFGGLVLGGRLLGLGGGAKALGALWSKLASVGAGLSSAWLWCSVAVVALAVGLVHRRHRRLPSDAGNRRRFLGPAVTLLRRPRSLGALLAASGSTTLILALAFDVTTALVPGPQPRAGIGAMVVAYMAAAAVGNAIPIPAGVGSTEAALVGVLVAAHVPAPHAVEVVLIFRLITFWSPAVVGVFVARRLRRSGAI